MVDHRVSKRFRHSTVKKEGQSEVTGKNLRKIRVICSDPEATDSSSDEADSGERPSTRRIVCEIVIGVEPEDDNESKQRKESLDQTERKKLAGVRLRKWGKWASEIRDPFTRKRIWLGTFNTAEEASKAYMAKKQEFQARKSDQTRPKSDDPYPVHWKKSSRWREAFYDKPEVQPGACDSDPEEEALKVLQSMKQAFGSGYAGPLDSDNELPLESEKIEPLSGSDGGGETVSGTTTTTNSAEDSKEEENKPPWLGLGIDMLVVDNHGNLLGQFSRLDDDLKIC